MCSPPILKTGRPWYVLCTRPATSSGAAKWHHCLQTRNRRYLNRFCWKWRFAMNAHVGSWAPNRSKRMAALALGLALVLILLSGSGTRSSAQERGSHIRVVVNLVQLNVAVTDKNGNYITGLRPENFAIYEDGIPEKLATFAEGNGPARALVDLAQADAKADSGADTAADRVTNAALSQPSTVTGS